jgi:hypothetical protein
MLLNAVWLLSKGALTLAPSRTRQLQMSAITGLNYPDSETRYLNGKILLGNFGRGWL